MRIFAMISAALLVAAFALANLLPATMDLNTALLHLDHTRLLGLQDAAQHAVPWVWQGLVLPLLARPAWFLPMALGVVFGGLALSLASGSTTRSRSGQG